MIPGVPYDAEVEYIEITRYDSGVVGPYIDTGIVVVPNDKVSVDWQGLSTWANDLKLFGSYIGYGWATFYGGVWRPLVGNFVQSSSLRDTNRHTIVFENHTCFLDGTPIASGSGNFSDISFYLFAVNGQPLTSSRLEQRVYSLSIERSGEKVLDMIPVRFTNELGQSEGAMYDRVSRKLFRNQGTGSFATGPDVAVPVMGLHFMRRPRYTAASDYVQDGLVAMWDGIENAGWGVHDPNATVWKDLVGNLDATASASPKWTDTSFIGDRTVAFLADGSSLLPVIANGRYSIEVRIGEPRVAANEGGYFSFGNVGSGATASTGIFIKGNMGTNTAYNASVNGGSYGRNGTMTGRQSFSIAANETSFSNYIDGVYTGTKTATCAFAPPNANLYLGRYYYSFGYSQSDIQSVRIYSRALSADEIAHNYAVDKERFNLP